MAKSRKIKSKARSKRLGLPVFGQLKKIFVDLGKKLNLF
jgi:hypothetical protein